MAWEIGPIYMQADLPPWTDAPLSLSHDSIGANLPWTFRVGFGIVNGDPGDPITLGECQLQQSIDTGGGFGPWEDTSGGLGRDMTPGYVEAVPGDPPGQIIHPPDWWRINFYVGRKMELKLRNRNLWDGFYTNSLEILVSIDPPDSGAGVDDLDRIAGVGEGTVGAGTDAPGANAGAEGRSLEAGLPGLVTACCAEGRAGIFATVDRLSGDAGSGSRGASASTPALAGGASAAGRAAWAGVRPLETDAGAKGG